MSKPSFGTKEYCVACTKIVYISDKIIIDNKVMHAACFRCYKCNTKLNTGNYSSLEGIFFCKPHFKEAFTLKGKLDFGKTPTTAAEKKEVASGTVEETSVKGVAGKLKNLLSLAQPKLVQGSDIQSKPAEEAKPVEVKPAEEKPAPVAVEEPKPAVVEQVKPVEATPVVEKPAPVVVEEPKPVEPAPVVVEQLKPVEETPVEQPKVEETPAPTKPTEEEHVEPPTLEDAPKVEPKSAIADDEEAAKQKEAVEASVETPAETPAPVEQQPEAPVEPAAPVKVETPATVETTTPAPVEQQPAQEVAKTEELQPATVHTEQASTTTTVAVPEKKDDKKPVEKKAKQVDHEKELRKRKFEEWSKANHTDDKFFPLNWQNLTEEELNNAIGALLDKTESLPFVAGFALHNKLADKMAALRVIETLISLLENTKNTETQVDTLRALSAFKTSILKNHLVKKLDRLFIVALSPASTQDEIVRSMLAFQILMAINDEYVKNVIVTKLVETLSLVTKVLLTQTDISLLTSATNLLNLIYPLCEARKKIAKWDFEKQSIDAGLLKKLFALATTPNHTVLQASALLALNNFAAKQQDAVCAAGAASVVRVFLLPTTETLVRSRALGLLQTLTAVGEKHVITDFDNHKVFDALLEIIAANNNSAEDRANALQSITNGCAEQAVRVRLWNQHKDLFIKDFTTLINDMLTTFIKSAATKQPTDETSINVPQAQIAVMRETLSLISVLMQMPEAAKKIAEAKVASIMLMLFRVPDLTLHYYNLRCLGRLFATMPEVCSTEVAAKTLEPARGLAYEYITQQESPNVIKDAARLFFVSTSKMLLEKDYAHVPISLPIDGCIVCNKVTEKLSRCSTCKSVQYCSRECQVKHWGNHKAYCNVQKQAVAEQKK